MQALLSAVRMNVNYDVLMMLIFCRWRTTHCVAGGTMRGKFVISIVT